MTHNAQSNTATAPVRRLRVIAATSRPVAELRVACATGDLRHIDQHFGQAAAYAVYDVAAEEIGLREVLQFDAPPGAAHGELGLPGRIRLLDGVELVLCTAVGNSAIRQLVSAHIQPLQQPAGIPISEALADIRSELSQGPGQRAAWLRRIEAGRRRDDTRFATMADRSWAERRLRDDRALVGATGHADPAAADSEQ